uniref:Uncharacterized protein n=1 Tax=Oryza sativa subsp. japonica TaxID=39947 RepID=Q69SU6_ORYSJ|nr:hypothetical protein [Oryza sativa Japonica Group]
MASSAGATGRVATGEGERGHRRDGGDGRGGGRPARRRRRERRSGCSRRDGELATERSSSWGKGTARRGGEGKEWRQQPLPATSLACLCPSPSPLPPPLPHRGLLLSPAEVFEVRQ